MTGAGRTLVESLFPISEAASAATLSPLSPEERDTLLDLLRRIATPVR